MGTETRVGIVAGLLIVVIASLYFYYGQSRPDQDILITANSTVSPPPKIPLGSPAAPQQKPSTSSDKLAMHTPPKPAVMPPISSRGATPSFTSHPTIKPADTPSLAQATPPVRPTIVAPIFPPTPKSAPVVKKHVDINDDSSDDLSESTWDHLASTPAQPVKSGGTVSPAPAISGSQSPVKFASANTSRQLSASPSSPPPRTPDIHKSPAPATIDKSAGQSWPRKHTVAKGETLSGISFAYYDDHNHINDILTANPQLKSPKALRIGQILEIPAPKGAAVAAKTSEPDARLALANQPRSEFTSLMARSAAPASNEKKPVILPDKTPNAVSESPKLPEQSYTTREGDTFYSIAKKVYGDGKKWQRIYDANKSTVKNNPKGLRKGMTLTIPR